MAIKMNTKNNFGTQITGGLANNDNHIIYFSHQTWDAPGKAREVVGEDSKDAVRGPILAKS
jgi:hypothetical protein